MSSIDYIGGRVRIRSPAELGALIRARRRQLGLEQSVLAGKVGVSRQWIIDIERGKPRAAVGLILHTLNALGIVLDARSGPAKKANPTDPAVDLNELIDAARKPRS